VQFPSFEASDVAIDLASQLGRVGLESIVLRATFGVSGPSLRLSFLQRRGNEAGVGVDLSHLREDCRLQFVFG